jgi:transcriptional regulator GlxA family with amidase domain
MARKQVFIACFTGVEILDIAGPASVFGNATSLLGNGTGYDVHLAAISAGSVETASGIALTAEQTLGSIRGPIDTVIVPGGLRKAVAGAAALAPLIRRLSPRARRVASVCTGAFILSQAGLLDGRAVVTHWAACDALRKRNPRCRVEDDRIFVRDKHVWTSAGASSGISQFSAPLAAQVAEREVLRDLLPWMSENVHADLSVGALARRTKMSERTFARVFVAETKFTPAAYVERLRIDAARRTLETTKKTVKQIARSCGFDRVETMHRAFKRTVGVTPLQYRARFA